MPAFSYVVIDGQGRTRRGVVEAESARQARAGLRDAGLVPVSLGEIDPESASGGLRGLFVRRHRLSSAELALFTRRFALLLEAGLTVEQCLDALIDQARTEPSSRTLMTVRAEVVAGHSLAVALERHPSSFPDIYCALVGTGEQSGELARVMLRLADYLEARQMTRQSAGLALLYPAIVALVALLIVVGLLTYVVPQVVEVFQHSRQTLPLLTRLLLWTSNALNDNLLVLSLAAAGALIGLRAAWTHENTRGRWQQLVLRMPVIGPIFQGTDTARFASTLAILVNSGVPLLQALGAGARVVNLIPLRGVVEEASRLVREGSSLHRALARGGLFPAIFVHLVASGEASGRLGHLLAQAARQQEFENDVRIRLLTGILEPAVIVVMGMLVLLIVLAILLPIIELNQLIRP